MSIFDILYTIVIGSLKLVFEFIFSTSYKLTNSYGLSIIVLSFVLNILLLPLYKKADELQQKENEIQSVMKPDLDFLKKTFSGNEQFMMIQTYYRQHNYKPIYALRSSISLLLQIPFFMAAYSFLSNIPDMNGASFGVIKDLSLPDQLFYGINVLPVLMTLVNTFSAIVYTKGQPIKSKIQLFVMALVFLVLLYNAPSALSFYYLLNNVFSLLKNIFAKLPNKVRIISVLCILFGIGLLYIGYSGSFFLPVRIMLFGMAIIIILFFSYVFYNNNFPVIYTDQIPHRNDCFLLSGLFLAVLIGLLIPSSVINASPEEFVGKLTFVNPNVYVLSAFCLSLGLFVLWLNVFYFLMDEKYQRVFGLIMWLICGVFVGDYLLFNNNLGNMSRKLHYDTMPSFSSMNRIANFLYMVLISVIFIYIWVKHNKSAKNMITVSLCAILIMSSVNMIDNNKQAVDAFNKIGKYSVNDSQILPLSKSGNNVVVIMLDRAISLFFPYLLEEKPELIEQFSGFIYYPNTISFGGTTNTGAPALYGGYEYTPEELNKRKTELLVNKHNESIKVMPVLFYEEGYDTVVCDPPYAGYTWIPDLSIYDDYPDMKTYITEGNYSYEEDYELEALRRNLFCFGLTKVVPNVFFYVLYDDGHYFRMNEQSYKEDTSVSFVNWYEVLAHLNQMTSITDNKGSLLLIQNSITHEPTLLSEPEYTYFKDGHDQKEFNDDVDYTKESIYGKTIHLDNLDSLTHYQANMAAMIQLGKWFDYLRDNNLYDNTKIIIVSDHGAGLGIKEDLITKNEDFLKYNALLLFKDFNSVEFKIDESFMTNADVIYLATKDVISDPINPFTGKKIIEENKNGKFYHVFGTNIWETDVNNGITFIDDKWYSVHDNCLDLNNWELIEDPSK